MRDEQPAVYLDLCTMRIRQVNGDEGSLPHRRVSYRAHGEWNNFADEIGQNATGIHHSYLREHVSITTPARTTNLKTRQKIRNIELDPITVVNGQLKNLGRILSMLWSCCPTAVDGCGDVLDDLSDLQRVRQQSDERVERRRLKPLVK